MGEKQQGPPKKGLTDTEVVFIVGIVVIFALLVFNKMFKAKQARIQAAISVRAEMDYKNCVQLLANVVEPVSATHTHYYFVSPEPDIGMLTGYSDDAGATVVRCERCPAHPEAFWSSFKVSEVMVVAKGPDGKFGYRAPPWLLGSVTIQMK